MTEGTNIADLEKMARKLRKHSITSTTKAGSGHPTTCMSCAEIMSTLFFNEMRFDPADPKARNVDVFVLSKGHAAPILWAALKEAGCIDNDLDSLRTFDSNIEGHPTPRNPWVRVTTGSLGQGLSAAAGMARARKMTGNTGRVFCLLGDGETAEGSVWEAASFAAFEKLDNLCAIVDINRLGQSEATMAGHDVDLYARRFSAFGFHTIPVDGHNVEQLLRAWDEARGVQGKPSVILARTFKGKGVSFTEDQDNRHGKPFSKEEEPKALAELGDVDIDIKVPARTCEAPALADMPVFSVKPTYGPDDKTATRQAYGEALAKLAEQSDLVAGIDGDTKNSTFAQRLKDVRPDRFVEAYIAEQNMVGVALGMATEGLVPFASTFAAFFTRAFDFIRIGGFSLPERLILAGSHAGISIGEDGPSQMALEDLAMMRTVHGSTVLYPSDGVSAEHLVALGANNKGVTYIRTSRPKTALLYPNDETFEIGGSKTLRSSDKDRATIVGAGVTLHEALKAADLLSKDGIAVRVIDLYSIKPVDTDALRKAAKETEVVITVEDHSVHGGIGDAVSEVVPCVRIGVDGFPRSATPAQLLAWAGIDAEGIARKVKESLS